MSILYSLRATFQIKIFEFSAVADLEADPILVERVTILEKIS